MFTKLLELNRIIEGKTPKTKLERLNQGLPGAYRHGIAICFDRATGATPVCALCRAATK